MSNEPLPAEGTVRDQVRETIRVLAGYRRYRNDTELARAMDRSRSFIQNYTGGRSSPNVEMLADFAALFDVPMHVLLMPTNQAMTWVLEHAPNPEPVSLVASERRRGQRSTAAHNRRRTTRNATDE
jgi:transcriptional regulator with XRE-family HTH domain